MIVSQILWDTDGMDPEDLGLPTKLEIPKELEEDEEAISDYLSDETGFCHFGFDLVDDEAKGEGV